MESSKREERIAEITGIPYIVAEQVLGGDIYYKVEKLETLPRVLEYLRKLRITNYETEILRQLRSTDFLIGVSGSALFFEVQNDFMIRDALPMEKGIWIHQSILIAFVCLSGHKGLDYVVRSMNPMLQEVEKLRKENQEFAITIARQNAKIADLQTSLDALNGIDVTEGEELPKGVQSLALIDTQMQIEFPKENELRTMKLIEGSSPKWIQLPTKEFYTLREINKAFKAEKVVIYGSKDYSENCYSDYLLEKLISQGVVWKLDQFNYDIHKHFGYSFISPRQENAKHHKTDLPVQYIKLNQYGLQHLLDDLIMSDQIEPVEIEFI